MARRFTEGDQAMISGTTLPEVMRLLPMRPDDPLDAARLDRDSRRLLDLSLVGDPMRWTATLPRGPLPIWQEDALLLRLIPQTMRLLGEAWASDTLSFVDVSIASARLQDVLRRYGVRASRLAETPVIPVILPPWEQHSFAAALAAHRICRAGRRGVMLSGLTADRLARMPVVQSAGVVLIMSMYRPKDARLLQFRKVLREGMRNAVTIVVGGPGNDASYMDTGTVTGAVCSVNDPVAALQACGVTLAP